METVDIAGIPVGALDRRAWVDHLAACVRGPGVHHHVSLNAGKWVAARRDPTLRRALLEATSVGADGASILWAARRLGASLPQRAAGFDLATALVARAPSERWRVGLLGAAPDVLNEVRTRLEARDVDVVHARDGYFSEHEERALATAIRDAAPQLLLVAMGSPRTEHFFARWGPVMAVPLTMGVGGTFDVWAGRARRAPEAVQRAGLEWAWRWAGSPRARFRRAIVDSALFAAAIYGGRTSTSSS